MADLVTLPDITTVIDQQYLIEPLGGPQQVQTYLDRFPDEVYNKTLDSHLVKYLYALLGPSGVGWLRKNYLQARLLVEELGLETFDLDSFYGNPLQFGRILEEVYNDDPNGLLPRNAWARIKARDAQYRNRAIDFVNGARMGNTPAGMHLVARSGLAHEVEIVENYRSLYDTYSDDPLNLTYYGETRSTEEMIILPRRELSRSEVQELRIDGTPTGGIFRLFFPMGNEATNTTSDIPYNVDRFTLQLYLEALPTIGQGNITLTGGPLPDTPIQIAFTKDLAARDLPELSPTSSFTGGFVPLAVVTTTTGGVEAADEIVNIAPRNQRYLQSAIDRIRAQTTIPTIGSAPGLKARQIWNNVVSTSSFTQVARYVTGQSGIVWPPVDSTHWIEAGVEHEGPKPFDAGTQHYQCFHNVVGLTASSEHLGPFLRSQTALYPLLAAQINPTFVYRATLALPPYADLLTMTDADGTNQFINGIYPVDYQKLPGAPSIIQDPNLFWASAERNTVPETLIIDLGTVQAVNYLYFEMTRKPVDIGVEYESHNTTVQNWQSITLNPAIPSNTSASFDFEALNPWELMEINLTNAKGEMVYTRYVRITFNRREDAGSPFVSSDGSTKLPWSIEVRNLRVGRNVI